jgi:large subunit ribosomal protein L24
MRKIKKGDTVVAVAGKNKGQTGTVLSVVLKKKRPETGLWVYVQGLNMCTKYVKANPQADIKGGIEKREAAMHISNIALLNPVTNKADKVGFKFLDDENKTKIRYFKSTNEVVDV